MCSAARTHRIVRLDLRAIGGSAATADVEVPKDRTADDMAHGIPARLCAARNTILLGTALGYAETVSAFDIFIGANVLDYSAIPIVVPNFSRRSRTSPTWRRRRESRARGDSAFTRPS